MKHVDIDTNIVCLCVVLGLAAWLRGTSTPGPVLRRAIAARSTANLHAAATLFQAWKYPIIFLLVDSTKTEEQFPDMYRDGTGRTPIGSSRDGSRRVELVPWRLSSV